MRLRAGLFTLALLATPRLAMACPVCFGQTDSPLASATNLGILVMLGVVGAVLASFGAFIFYLSRRARLAARSESYSVAPQEGIAQC